MIFFKLNKSLIRDAKTVLTGTSLSQIIPLLFYPLLTRIYSPEDFGLLALFMSICSVMTVIASGTYEQAIIVTKNKLELENLIKIIFKRSILLLIILSIILITSLYLFDFLILYKKYSNWIIILSLTALFTIIFNVFNEWCVKNKEFKKLATNKVYNALFISSFKSLNKLLLTIPNGLIIGEFLGKFLVSLMGLKIMYKNGTKIFTDYKTKILINTKKKFKEYPKYMMFDMLINTLGGSVHVYIILGFFGSTELGYLSLSLSLLTLPVTVISGGIKDVFRERANKLYNSIGSCRNLYIQLLKPIAIIGLLGFVILFLVAPYIIPFFLGDAWVKSGLYSQFLIPLFYFNFVSMSLGGIFVISNKIKISLYWQIFNITITIFALIVGSVIYNSMSITLILFSVAKTISYILYMLLSYKFSLNPYFDKN